MDEMDISHLEPYLIVTLRGNGRNATTAFKMDRNGDIQAAAVERDNTADHDTWSPVEWDDYLDSDTYGTLEQRVINLFCQGVRSGEIFLKF